MQILTGGILIVQVLKAKCLLDLGASRRTTFRNDFENYGKEVNRLQKIARKLLKELINFRKIFERSDKKFIRPPKEV